MNFEDTFSLEDLPMVVEKILLKNVLPLNSIVILSGELGAGKTTFTRTFFQKFGINDVTSPTYNLHNEYIGQDIRGLKIILNHWDLYRCTVVPEELLEPLTTKTPQYTFVEWGERFASELKSLGFIQIRLEIIDQNHRKIIISA
jgi:tRNA threonylcarbamoyladenosine biosynthesis protein TsaE